MYRYLLAGMSLLAAVSAAPAQANVTASVHGIQTSGSEPASPNAPLTVLREKLQIVCHDDSGCRVRAVYTVRADADVTADLAFITDMPPTDGHGNAVSVTHGDATSRINMTPKLTFTSRLHRGENTIEINYAHAIAANLVQPAYFNSYTLHYITYDLWPLKEWKLADDFSLDIELYYYQKSLGLWGWLTGAEYRQVAITAWDRTKGSNDIARPASVSLANLDKGWTDDGYNHLHWQAAFKCDFPDRLLVYFAPAAEVRNFNATGQWQRAK